jgi:hypothetical protein
MKEGISERNSDFGFRNLSTKGRESTRKLSCNFRDFRVFRDALFLRFAQDGHIPNSQFPIPLPDSSKEKAIHLRVTFV